MSEALVSNSDCLEGLKRMPDEVFDLALIDPPYFDYKTSHRKDKEDKLSKGIIQQTQEEQIEVIRECVRCLRPDSAFFVFTNWENIHWMQRPFPNMFRNMIIWDKGNWTAGDLNGSFGNQYEVVFLGVKGKKWKYQGKRESDIWTIPRVGTNRVHPTEKPVELYIKCIVNSCSEGAWIVDPYGGSGTSTIAALETNRNIIVYELDEQYYKIINDRKNKWKNGQTKEAV